MHKDYFENHNKNALCWVFFYVNDNKEVDLIAPQIMHYILLQQSNFEFKSKNSSKRGLIIYYNTTNRVPALRKHVNVDHSNILK